MIRFYQYSIALLLVGSAVYQKCAAQLVFTEYSYRTGVPARSIFFVRKETEGAWLFGTVNGLYRFNGVNFFPYFNRRNVPPVVSHSAARSGFMLKNKLYLATTTGRYVYDAKQDKITASVTEDGSPLFFDTCGGKLLIAYAKQGILELDAESLKETKKYDPKGIVFIAKGKGKQLLLVNNNQELLEYRPELGLRKIMTLPATPTEYCINKDGRVSAWVFKDKVLYGDTSGSINFIIKRFFNKIKLNDDALYGHQLRDIHKDAYGLIWHITIEGALLIYESPQKSNLVFSDRSIRAMVEDAEGNFFISTYDKSYIRKKNSATFSHLQALKSTAWCAIPIDKTNKHFFLPLSSGEKVILHTENANIEPVKWFPDDVLILNYTVTKDQKTILVGRGIYEIDLNSRKYKTLLSNELFGYQIYTIAEIDAGHYIFGSTGGTFSLETGTGAVKKIHGAECRWIKDAGHGYFIAGTLGSGILKISKTDLKVGLVRSGISEIDRDFPYSGALTPDGSHLIVGTQRGLYALNSRDFEVSYIPSSMEEYNTSALYFDKAGNLYAGGITGVEFFKNSTLFDISVLPPTDIPFVADIRNYVAGLGMVNTYALGAEVIRLQPDYLSTEITLGSAHSLVQKTIIYRYRINGYQDSWVNLLGEPGNSPQILLTRLPPGKYKLDFQHQTAIGTWSKANSVIIESIAAYYETIWFRTLVYAGIAGVVILISLLLYRRRLRKIKLANTIADLKNRVTHSELTALRSQVNPHMFANSLQTLQYYIYNNDKEAASDYLNRYSKLMRSTLELSAEDMVPIPEKIEYLRRYCEFENLKIENRVKITINTEGINEPETISMPTMIIQPFVENAFKHGFRNAPEEIPLELNIVLKLENKKLICIVSNTATTTNQAETLHRVSGNSIIKERLKLYGELFNSEGEIESSYKGHTFEVKLKIPYLKTFVHGKP